LYLFVVVYVDLWHWT